MNRSKAAYKSAVSQFILLFIPWVSYMLGIFWVLYLRVGLNLQQRSKRFISWQEPPVGRSSGGRQKNFLAKSLPANLRPTDSWGTLHCSPRSTGRGSTKSRSSLAHQGNPVTSIFQQTTPIAASVLWAANYYLFLGFNLPKTKHFVMIPPNILTSGRRVVYQYLCTPTWAWVGRSTCDTRLRRRRSFPPSSSKFD